MGLSIGSLVQTASGAVDKHRQLQKEAEARARQQQMDVLQRALMQAQIGHLGAQSQALTAPKPTEPFTLSPGAGRYDASGKLLVQQPGNASEGGFTLPAGGARYDKTGKLIMQRAEKPSADPSLKPLSRLEIAAAQRAREALHQMRDLYRADPTAAQTPVLSAALKGIGNIPLVGGIARGLTDPAAQHALTPAQQAFQRAAVQLRHNAAALSPHARLQLGFLEDINRAYVPPSGTDPQAIQSTYAPEWDSLLDQMNSLLGQSSSPAPAAQRPVSQSPAGPAPSSGIVPRFWKPRTP